LSRTPAPEVAPPDLPGYRFITNIGSGGNAQVYLFEQNLPRRKVAVKVLNESALSDEARRRFTTEANVTAGLAHPHIVQVFEANVTPAGRPYLVMPYYPQPNLSVRARRSHFSVAQVLRIGIQIGSAVETSHRGGVLHRDIKPQNILTDSYGEPALTDFGIATTKGGDGPEGLSVPWSPPEILFGTAPGDQCADVYSLGATLWHLLVGRSPFEVPGDNGRLALTGRIKSDPPPRTQRSDVPDSLERLLRQAMAKDPAARPQSAMELIRGLQSVEQELRLPLTQPTLSAEEPLGDTQGSDTISRPHRPPQPVQPAWGATSQSAWGTDRRAETIVRGGEAAGPWVPPARSRPAENDNVTLKRAPVRIDPMGSPAAGSPRVRQLPREAPETATVARPLGGANSSGTTDAGPFGGTGTDRVGTPAGPAGVVQPGQRINGRGRVLALVAGGAALAVAAGVAVAALSHGGGQPGGAPSAAGQSTQAGGANNAVGEGAAAPGTPAITATMLSATQVKFSWKYDNSAPGDTFPWSVSGTVGKSTGQATKPELTVTVPSGKVACLEVRVTSAEGEASDESQPVCWPQ
jgi:serine/threonine protein kinase